MALRSLRWPEPSASVTENRSAIAVASSWSSLWSPSRACSRNTAGVPGLAHPFYRLPVQFDGARMFAEVQAFDLLEWRPDRFGIPGYWSLNLVSYLGLDNDQQRSPWVPAARLERLPYVSRCLRSLGLVCSEVRLRWLEPGTEVGEHYDTDLYWFTRYRLHVPITTDPAARFRCDGADVHMRAGECWLFDRLRLHSVRNASPHDRMHLIIDTPGSETLWKLLQGADVIAAGTSPTLPPCSQQSPPACDTVSDDEGDLETEREPAPFAAISPPAFREYVHDLLERARGAGILDAARFSDAVGALERAQLAWARAWARWGSREAAWPTYLEITSSLRKQLWALETPAPVTALRPSLAGRMLVFLACAFDPTNQPPPPGPIAADTVLGLRGELLCSLSGDDAFVLDPRCGFASLELDVTELLLLSALASGLGPSRAAEIAGVEDDEQTREVMQDFVEAGLLEVCYPPPVWPRLDGSDPAAPSEATSEPGASPAEISADRPRETHTVVIREPPLYVRVLTNGTLVFWNPGGRRYLHLPRELVRTFVALAGGKPLGEACAEGQLVLDANVLGFVRDLEAAGFWS